MVTTDCWASNQLCESHNDFKAIIVSEHVTKHGFVNQKNNNAETWSTQAVIGVTF